MSEVKEIHDQAMALAEKASIEKLNGNLEQANILLRQAYEKEYLAANLLSDISSPEPTRSILFRSAASLAIDCDKLREAEKLLSLGLAGNPPQDIAEELRDLFEKVNFQRHLQLRGVVLEEDELQMSIAGKAVSVGIAPIDQLIGRIDFARKLVFRTIERLLGKPYREVGAMGGVLREYGLFVSVPRSGSFSVTLKVSHPQKSLPGFEQETQIIESSKVIDEILSCLDNFNSSEEQQLREKIQEEAYFRNFVGIAKSLAPDGNEVRQVGFTSLRCGQEKRVNLITPRESIKLV